MAYKRTQEQLVIEAFRYMIAHGGMAFEGDDSENEIEPYNDF